MNHAEEAEAILQELQTYIDPIKREYLPRFFKTGPGQYGEGDRFLGVVVPHTRQVARHHRQADPGVATLLLQSPWHECRLCALLMLVERFAHSNETQQKALFDFYLAHTERINNWDLVDLSAPTIVGGYLLTHPRDVLRQLAASPLLWDQRIAMVSTLTLIRNGQYFDTLALAETFLTTPHDLMQKAVGWMLREVGKRDRDLLVQFLHRHSLQMPRTMLRYAIEKFPEPERRAWLQRKNQ